MANIRTLIAATLTTTFLAGGMPLYAAQPAVMSPAPGSLGGTQPMSTTATNNGPQDTHTTWSPSLPPPPVDDGAPPAAFLDAARRAIAANRTGEAQESLERAESRALDRAIKPSTAGQPSGQPLVQQIAHARQVLGAGDRLGAVRVIENAMKTAEAKAAN